MSAFTRINLKLLLIPKIRIPSMKTKKTGFPQNSLSTSASNLLIWVFILAKKELTIFRVQVHTKLQTRIWKYLKRSRKFNLKRKRYLQKFYLKNTKDLNNAHNLKTKLRRHQNILYIYYILHLHYAVLQWSTFFYLVIYVHLRAELCVRLCFSCRL